MAAPAPTAPVSSAPVPTAGSAPSLALAPSSTKLGIFPEFANNTTESLYAMTADRLALGKDSTVKDAHGKTAFEVKSKTISLHDRKEIFDAHGKHLFSITKRLVSFHTTFDIADSQYPDKALASVSQTKKHSHEAGDELKISFKNFDSQQVHLQLKGSLQDRQADITHNGQPIARIAHTFNDSRFSLKAKEAYALSVAAGVDVALLVAIAICLDELDDDIKS